VPSDAVRIGVERVGDDLPAAFLRGGEREIGLREAAEVLPDAGLTGGRAGDGRDALLGRGGAAAGADCEEVVHYFCCSCLRKVIPGIVGRRGGGLKGCGGLFCWGLEGVAVLSQSRPHLCDNLKAAKPCRDRAVGRQVQCVLDNDSSRLVRQSRQVRLNKLASGSW
jgi:hypothetical protein